METPVVKVYSTNSLEPIVIENAARIDLIINGIEYIVLPLSTGWFEIQGESLLIHHVHGSTYIRKDLPILE